MSLERHLQKATSQGELDSEGEFSIAGAAAIGKLASFQLPRDSAWVLKVVQAAVVSGAEEIRICQQNLCTEFVFEPAESLCGESLFDSLTHVPVPKDPVVAHLVVGLRTVGFGETRAFTVEISGAGERHRLTWTGEELQRSVERAEVEGTVVKIKVNSSPRGQPPYLGGVMTAKRRLVLEYQELVRNGEVCPIPLFVDGRRLDTVSAVPNSVGRTAVLSVGWYGVNKSCEVTPLELPTGLLKASKEWSLGDRFDDSRIFDLDGDPAEERVGCLVKVAYHYEILSYQNKTTPFEFQSKERHSEVCWVKDGVVCQRENLAVETSPVTYSLYLSAQDLKTDLSGLKLIDDPRTEVRIGWAQEHVAEQAARTLEALSRHKPQVFKEHAFALWFFGVLAVIAPGALLCKGLACLFLYGSAKLMAQDKKEIVDDALAHLKKLAKKRV